jgi:hypothetical protein
MFTKKNESFWKTLNKMDFEWRGGVEEKQAGKFQSIFKEQLHFPNPSKNFYSKNILFIKSPY